VHDGDRIIVERQGGEVTAVYSYGNALVARNGEVVLPDGLGTTRATVDGVQAITSTLTTEAFGNTVAQWGSTGNPYRFAGAWGYRDDGDAGLLHVGARYYDPQAGRFVSRDTVLSEHPYLYCEHEPVNRVDPSGRKTYEWLEVAGGLIASVGGLVSIVNPPAGSVIAFVGALVGGIGLGLHLGELIADALFPIDEEHLYIPPPSIPPVPQPPRSSEDDGRLLPPWHDPLNPYAPTPTLSM